MAKKELHETNASSSKKMQTKDLIYAGAFGAIYIVLMLLVIMAYGMVPILYIFGPLFVGIVCATVYELCVLKVRKFGAALILGILFALVSVSGYLPGLLLAILCAFLAELVIMAGKYRSKRMFLASFVVFNLNMVCPYTRLYFDTEAFLNISAGYYGQDYADGVAALATSWLPLFQIALAIIGALIGVFIASRLIRKHFEKAGIV